MTPINCFYFHEENVQSSPKHRPSTKVFVFVPMYIIRIMLFVHPHSNNQTFLASLQNRPRLGSILFQFSPFAVSFFVIKF